MNPWLGNQALSPGLIDNIAFGPIITESGTHSKVLDLLHILNEIKEAFSTARYLFFLSQNKSITLDHVSKITTYFSNDSFEINGLYTGLCKTAYGRAFDVLDKVARIINVYFEVGAERDSFWDVLAEKQSLGEEHIFRYIAKPIVCKKENIGLYALADLCIDYFESEHVDFKTFDVRRNKITHDFLIMKLYASEKGMNENPSIVNLDGFYAQTKKVLILAKYAIVYAVSAITIAEFKKQDHSEKTVKIEYRGTPGQSFL